MGPSRAALAAHVQITLNLATKLGFIINIEKSNPTPNNSTGVPRGTDSDPQIESTPRRPQDKESNIRGSETNISGPLPSEDLAHISGAPVKPCGRSPLMQDEDEVPSNPPTSTLSPKIPTSKHNRSTHTGNKRNSPKVDIPAYTISREGDDQSHPIYHDRDRRVGKRVGSPPRKYQNIEAMGRHRRKTAHQHDGNESSPARTEKICTSHQKQMRANKIRQYDGGRIHKQTRRNKVTKPLPPVCEHPSMVHGTQHHTQSVSHTREGQLCSGLLIPRELPADRMAAPPGRSKEDFSHDRDTADRLVCISTKPSLTNILHETPGPSSLCDGRAFHTMEGNSRLCLPILRTHSEGTRESDEGRGDHPTDSTILAQ